MKSKILKIYNLITIVALAVLLCLFCVFGTISSTTVYAAETDVSSTIMAELTSDPSFDKELYPDNATDYSLQVFQIGESETKDFYLYVYQPSHNSIDLLGTSVSISYGFSRDGKGLQPKIYDLELVSTSGVFDKYLVKGFKEDTGSNKDGSRYYNIVAIYRKFNEVIDSSIELGETNEIGYSVGQQWCAYDINNGVAYEMGTFETLEVTINIIGNAEFPNGFRIFNILGASGTGNAWFAAFTVEDYIVQHIYDADISFDIRSRERTWSAGHSEIVNNGEWERKTLKLTDEDFMEYKGNGIGGRSYKWNRITTSSDFIVNVENQKATFSDISKEKIKESQWVFSFYETELNKLFSQGYYYIQESEISEFAILRLHFMDTNKKIYDLGVVSDKVTPDNISDIRGSVKSLSEIMDDVFAVLQKIFMAVCALALIAVVIALFKGVDFISKPIKFICKGIVSVITAPFKLLKKLFKKDG